MFLEIASTTDGYMIINMGMIESIRLIDSKIIIYIKNEAYRMFFDTDILAKNSYQNIRNNLIKEHSMSIECAEFDIY